MSVLNELKQERDYQIFRWGNKLDDTWKNNELIYGALSYLQDTLDNSEQAIEYWPSNWKETRPPNKDSNRSHLLKAASMIIAEIERLDRLT